MKYKQTPSQTIGPFFAHGLTAEQYRYNYTSIAHPVVADHSVPGEQIIVQGRVFDGAGNSCTDAMLECWQCDAEGRYSDRQQDPKAGGFKGFGRVGTGMNEAGRYEIRTIKPASIYGQAPHINVTLFMRGMLNHQFTRIYFSDEEDLNARDKMLNLVPEDRRQTLIARRLEIAGATVYEFNIYVQGEQETVFFDL
ncbi:protocatechuate 3,4-dioxygenase subunit alpha [Flavilitoribacter nigricans]|uniref:Protocatechuate 3,4-dioxygenase subunit alpha n=1 Tax=Flavilitoribacter nigricans (strain ATCC 23147 / DSM 23189 / NBRC 102662 / NCIMB 1420 / SS-2) TaxID=1122177 RepID=A0A2D0N0A5_FLAN2|nr:protocatechuate 3,4-dioxygenase subunit alpha [Flavilitoribacter nigricans]PHN01915.1 protocatechuate 3,4-dioxygenase subunit alpha [Flavilitoribacter nigricans DSM 23189 = NBRC 102662]